MTRFEITDKYLKWLGEKVYDKRYPLDDYSRLFEFLYETTFIYTIPRDENRAEDGIDLRYKFGTREGLSKTEIAVGLNQFDCSVLEMMVALAIRCEIEVSGEFNTENIAGYWFWNMIENLGLGYMTNDLFDYAEATRIIDRLLYRQYEPNGCGGLFTVKKCDQDMRNVEIWYQLCWYLDELLNIA